MAARNRRVVSVPPHPNLLRIKRRARSPSPALTLAAVLRRSAHHLRDGDAREDGAAEADLRVPGSRRGSAHQERPERVVLDFKEVQSPTPSAAHGNAFIEQPY